MSSFGRTLHILHPLSYNVGTVPDHPLRGSDIMFRKRRDEVSRKSKV